MGIYGNINEWASATTSGLILSGPGQLTQYVGGFWEVTGLSTTEPTRIEITRSFAQAQTGGAYFYVDDPSNYRGGESLIASNAIVTKENIHGEIQKRLVRIDAPPAVAGGKPVSTTFTYNAAGDIIETKTGVLSENLLDLSGWAGEKSGPNLVDLSAWPASTGTLPAGPANVPGWQNHAHITDESRWAKTIGPDGASVAVIQTGQTDATEDGGGNFSNRFAIDKNKAYEFTTYIQVTELDKHRIYFGFDGSASLVNALNGAADGNPYFAYPYPDANSGLKSGHWYKIVGYIMPAGSGNLVNWSDLGGIYDVESGERVADVTNYRWNETQPAGATGAVRFFNYYDQAKQGYFTNYYQPEVHEINLSGGSGTVAGWNNSNAEETRWAATKGPDGKSVFAIQAGQTNPNEQGGGNHSSQIPVDRNKAYEFTYYLKFSSLEKHYAFLGINLDIPVENLVTGQVDTNPYFFYSSPAAQSALVPDRWYKVVGYVLPQGSTAVPSDQIGGVFDTTTGAKVDSVYNNFRWSASGGGTERRCAVLQLLR